MKTLQTLMFLLMASTAMAETDSSLFSLSTIIHSFPTEIAPSHHDTHDSLLAQLDTGVQTLASLPLYHEATSTYESLQPGKDGRISFWEFPDSFNRRRFWTATGIGTGIYAGTVVGLFQIWYQQYELEPLHLFNDWGEWENLDKMGHALTAYNEARWTYEGMKWTGVSERRAAWTGFGVGSILQLSLETLDGFSAKWGFSLGDIGFNTLGCSVFTGQQLLWGEQRILLKASSWRTSPYPNTLITSTDGLATTALRDRAHELYGTNYANTFFKDYNAMSTWASVNVASFLPDNTRFPSWLNVAVGYGADNLYAGFGNTWEQNGHTFALSPEVIPIKRQFYLSLDLDLTKFKTKPGPVRVLLFILNSIKIPAPTLEINDLGEVKFHPIFF